MNEAVELARKAFRSAVERHLTAEEILEIRTHSNFTSGTVGKGWAAILGGEPDPRMFYEVGIYRPSESWPYAEKIFVRILVPRDRALEDVHFMWRPPLHSN